MPDISVVIPAKNEQHNIAPLLEEINAALSSQDGVEIIVIDDASSDNTLGRLQQLKQQLPNLRILRHQHCAGQSTAIYHGVQQATGRLIVTLDGDGQNDPADIPRLLALSTRYTSEQHFCIAGFRKNRQDTLWKRWQSKIANGIRGTLLQDHCPDTGCGLKLFPRHSFLQLPYFDHMHRFIPALMRRLDADIVTVEVNHRPRRSGQSNYTMLGRACVGLVDLVGVLWLQRRNRLNTEITED